MPKLSLLLSSSSRFHAHSLLSLLLSSSPPLIFSLPLNPSPVDRTNRIQRHRWVSRWFGAGWFLTVPLNHLLSLLANGTGGFDAKPPDALSPTSPFFCSLFGPTPRRLRLKSLVSLLHDKLLVHVFVVIAARDSRVIWQMIWFLYLVDKLLVHVFVVIIVLVLFYNSLLSKLDESEFRFLYLVGILGV
ncbi:hypothetical protein BVRB_4g086700 [Beta vulgaris subsp. vulgaris]|nr:hypothetical protein BVRB_4g086700 [Beta vulgaris subsp. vulgaris]